MPALHGYPRAITNQGIYVTLPAALIILWVNFMCVIINSLATEEDFQLRDPKTHREHCQLLQGPCNSEDSTTYGVNHDSCLC